MMGQLSAACSHSHFVRLFQKQLLQVLTAVVTKRCVQINAGWRSGSDNLVDSGYKCKNAFYLGGSSNLVGKCL